MAVIPTEGKHWIIDKLQDVAPLSNAKCDVGNWGTGSQPEAVTNSLNNSPSDVVEASEARITGTLSQPAADTDRLVFTQTANGTKNISEAFRTNTTTKGHASQVLYQRAQFFSALIPVQINDQIQFTFDNQAT